MHVRRVSIIEFFVPNNLYFCDKNCVPDYDIFNEDIRP